MENSYYDVVSFQRIVGSREDYTSQKIVYYTCFQKNEKIMKKITDYFRLSNIKSLAVV